MRRLLIVGFALALSGVGAFAQDASPTFDWSGLYAGAHVGVAGGTSNWTLGVGARMQGFDTGPARLSGALLGVQAGLNHQAGSFVFGVQADASWAGITGNVVTPDNPHPAGGLATCWGGRDASATCNVKKDWLGNLTLRAGVLVTPQALFYVKGGGAVVQDTFSITDGYWFDSPVGFDYFPVSQTRFGWTAGFGVEGALTDRVTAFLEYDCSDFGTQNVDFTPNNLGSEPFLAQPFTAAISQTVQLVKFGVNVKLN